MTCKAASATRTSPVTPIGLLHRVPPEGLTLSNAPMFERTFVAEILRLAPLAEAKGLQLRKLHRAEGIVKLDNLDLLHGIGDAAPAHRLPCPRKQIQLRPIVRRLQNGPTRSPMKTVLVIPPIPLMKAGREQRLFVTSSLARTQRRPAGRARAYIEQLIGPGHSRRFHHIIDCYISFEMRVRIFQGVLARSHHHSRILFFRCAVLMHVALGRKRSHGHGVQCEILFIKRIPDQIQYMLGVWGFGDAVRTDHQDGAIHA